MVKPRTVATLSVLLLVACDAPETSSNVDSGRPTESPESDVPDLDWQTALDAPASRLGETAGGFDEECDAERDDPPPRDWREMVADPKGCRPSTSSDGENAVYLVDRILYVDGHPVAAHLVPGDASTLPFGLDALDALDLPELEARRRETISSGGSHLDVLSMRRRHLGSDIPNDALVGIDIARTRGSRLERIVLYARGANDEGRALAAWRGPRLKGPQLTVPRSLSASSLFGAMAVELRPDRTLVRKWDDYPPHPPDARGEGTPFILEPSNGNGHTGTRWNALEETVRSAMTAPTGAEDRGALRMTYGVAANQTAEVGRLRRQLDVLDGRTTARFQLVLRHTDRLGAAVDRYPSRTGATLQLADDTPASQTRTGRRYLNLTLNVNSNGFDLEAGGERVSPIEGCDDSGPTICPADPTVELDATVRRAAMQQQEGNPAEAQRILAGALERLDWIALHRTVRRLWQRYDRPSRLYYTVSPDLPVAALARTLDVLRYKLRPKGADRCDAPPSGDRDLRDMVVCRNEADRPRRMFRRLLWRSEQE